MTEWLGFASKESSGGEQCEMGGRRDETIPTFELMIVKDTQ